MKKIWNIISDIIIGFMVVLAVMLVGMRLFGFQVYSVVSGSMEPLYRTGSIIYVRKTDYKELKAGDVITFMLGEDMIATHRIVEVIPDEEDNEVLRYRTKGDANETEDGGLVHYKNVLGKPVMTIPYLGYAVTYIQNPPGSYIAVAVGAFLMLLLLLPDLFQEWSHLPQGGVDIKKWTFVKPRRLTKSKRGEEIRCEGEIQKDF